MGRALAALALVFVCAAPLATARSQGGVTPSSIAGITLGMTEAKARSLLAKPVLLGRLEGYRRFTSERAKVEVYFRTGVVGAVVVTTWSRALQTNKHIGPCSPVAALKAAYGAQLRPFRQAGKVIAYRLGNLVFTTEGGKRVGVVALGRGTASTYVALNAPECG